jgi:hypothetical protein
MKPAIDTFAGLDHARVLQWATTHADPLIRELAERMADVLAEMDEALRSAIDRAEVAERHLAASDEARRRERGE